jgi:hypothetical protein
MSAEARIWVTASLQNGAAKSRAVFLDRAPLVCARNAQPG